MGQEEEYEIGREDWGMWGGMWGGNMARGGGWHEETAQNNNGSEKFQGAINTTLFHYPNPPLPPGCPRPLGGALAKNSK